MRTHTSPFSGRIGTARADITPPVGIFNRNWGAATGDVSTGIHRPLTATALALQESNGGSPLLLLSLDLGWWRTLEDEWAVRAAILNTLDIDESRVLLHLTHTHAGPGICIEDADKPGGTFIPAYLNHLRNTCAHIAREALASARPGRLEWGYGKCTLARNRDLPDPAAPRVLCGWNPNQPADDTLLIGRATDEQGALIATLVNYACHPVTLAWQNSLISPDFVGAMRETIEAHTKAPCLFLQGASGELAPREHYVGNVDIADRNGRVLGFAALAALEEMPPPNTDIEYAGPVESGAPLATWRRARHQDSERTCALESGIVPYVLHLKPLQSLTEVKAQLANTSDEFMRERLRRKLRLLRSVGEGPHYTARAWGWRIGEALLLAQPMEAYSRLQTELRAAVPDRALTVMNITNGSYAYLAPREMYDFDQYQVWQSPFTAGCLEIAIDALHQWATALP